MRSDRLVRLALAQQRATEDLEANRSRGLEAVREAARAGAQVVAFAELAFSPFYPQREPSSPPEDLAEPIPGPTTEAFAEAARELGVVVVLNLYERADQACYDASPVIDADGTLLGTTRMIHITDYPCFREQAYYAPGDLGAPVYATRFGRLGVAICYDRHYPEYMRALALDGAELVVVPQAGAVDEWPEGLYEAEMRVAAFQNGYFAALVNRVGREERLEFAGESFVCDPAGRVVARAGRGREEILYADVDLDEVGRSHGRRLFHRDRRPELYGAWLGPGVGRQMSDDRRAATSGAMEERERAGEVASEVSIEPAGASDAVPIAEFSALLGYPTDAEAVRRRLETLDEALHTVLVARLDGEVVGWVHAFRSDRLEEDPFAELGGLIVASELRGCGLGRRLLSAAENWAVAAGCRKLRIRSHERRREAHRFYEQVGYRRVKRQQVLDRRLDEKETT